MSRILRGTSALLAIACAKGCGPSTNPMTEASTASTGASESDDAVSGASASGTSASPDMGSGLPEGCGDGAPEPGRFCFELVQVYERKPSGAAAFDLDADGTDELLVGLDKEQADGPCGGRSDYLTCTRILRWTGGEFAEIGQVPLEVTGFEDVYHPHLDFDGDGRIDFVIKTALQGVGVLLNRGGQTLESADLDPSWEVPQGDWVMGGAFPFKVDGQGYADLLVGFEAGLQLHAREEGAWVPKGPMLPLPNCLMHPAARGDFDEDGIEDVLVMGAILGCDFAPAYGEDPEFFAVHAYRSNPSTGLLDPWPLILPGAPVDDLWVRDFDSDGHLDILFQMIKFEDAYGTTWVRGRGDGTFADAVVLPTLGHVLDPGDFDGDGDIDLLVAWERGADNDLGILEDLSPPTDLTHKLTPEDSRGLASYSHRGVGDFNGDGVTDVALYVSTESLEGSGLRETAVWLSRP